MSDDVIPFRPKGKPEQLTLEEVRRLSPEDVERARQGGHLEDVLAGGKTAPVPPASPSSSGRSRGEQLADEILRSNKS